MTGAREQIPDIGQSVPRDFETLRTAILGQRHTLPKRIAQITSDGSPTNNLRTVTRLRVNVWDATDQKVTDLARLIVALVPRMVGANGVLWTVHQSGPYEITDAAGPRRFLLFEIHYRGALLA